MGVLTATLNASYCQADKKERWEAMEKEVNTWGDTFDMGVEPHIKKIVIVLNLLGFTTIQSCEGHMNQAFAYPWVRISTETPEITNVIKERDENPMKFDQLTLTIEKTLKTSIKPLCELLGEFYKHRKVDPETMLTIQTDSIRDLTHVYTFVFELSSPDGCWQVTRENEEKQRKLDKYRQEMDAFADFLIEYYFENQRRI